MNLISLKFSIVLRLLSICSVNVQSSSTNREGRLLDAKWIEREQINSNYKGSGSIAIVYTAKFLADVGAIVSKDKILLLGSAGMFTNARVSALTRGTTANQDFMDGEEYSISTTSSVPNSDFSTLKFGPLLSTSKAFVATLPSATNRPPKPGNKDCIVYTYAPNKEGDTNPSNFRLGYLPLTIEENSVCAPEYSDTTKYVCASVVSNNGSNPFCATAFSMDVYMVAYCPKKALTREDKSEEQNKGLCIILGDWSLGLLGPCDNDNEDKDWILIGLMEDYISGGGCNTPKEKLYVVFAYTGNLTLA